MLCRRCCNNELLWTEVEARGWRQVGSTGRPRTRSPDGSKQLQSRRPSHSGSAMFLGPYRSAAHLDPAFPVHRLDQHVCRNAEFVMQIANHIQRQRTISSHHFVHTSALAEHTNQGPKVLPLLFQSKLDCLNRIGKIDWITLSL
jgi:hypothetical protein